MTNAQLYLAVGVPMLFNALTTTVWRAELHRVEEVLDARLKHLEASL